MKVYLLGLAASLLVSRLEATDRFFRNLEVTSPNGRFRVEAKSPDNVEGPRSKPFQSNFLYRFLEEGGDLEVWSRQQPVAPDGQRALEGPPVAIHVSNDSWVVVRTANALLVVVDPSGQDRLRIDILGSLFPDSLRSVRYQRISSAGTQWGAAYCHPYFVALGGKTHFCLTTWWGERLLINLPAGCAVPVSPEFETVLNETEKSFLMSTLQATSLWKYEQNRKINPGLTKDSPGPAASAHVVLIMPPITACRSLITVPLGQPPCPSTL